MVRCIECLDPMERPLNTEKVEWQSGETSEVAAHEDCVPKRTTQKLFTKSHFEKLQEKKYAEPTERAKKIIDEAEDDDRLNLKIRLEGKPKVLEATRIQSQEDLVISMDAKEPFDSEKLEEN